MKGAALSKNVCKGNATPKAVSREHARSEAISEENTRRPKTIMKGDAHLKTIVLKGTLVWRIYWKGMLLQESFRKKTLIHRPYGKATLSNYRFERGRSFEFEIPFNEHVNQIIVLLRLSEVRVSMMCIHRPCKHAWERWCAYLPLFVRLCVELTLNSTLVGSSKSSGANMQQSQKKSLTWLLQYL